MRIRGALAAAAVLAALPVTAHAHETGRVRTYDVRFDYEEPPGAYDGIVCEGVSTPQSAAVDSCRYVYKGVAYFTGDVAGVQHYALETWFGPDGRLHYRGSVTFQATVARCGAGSFRVYEVGYIEMLKSNPATGRVPGFNTWQVLPETATGTLKGRLLGGAGVNHWQAAPAESDHDFGRGTFTGKITCRR